MLIPIEGSSHLLDTIDIMARNASTGLFVMMAVLILRDYGFRLRPVLGALAALTGATYTICTKSWAYEAAQPILYMAWPFCILGPVHIWLFSLALFQDDFRMRPIHWACAITFLVLGRLHFDVFEGQAGLVPSAVFVVYSMIRLGLIAHMLFVAWQGRAEDLLETRRQFRTFYIVFAGAAISIIFVVETFFSQVDASNSQISLLQALGFLGLAIGVFWHATKANTGILLQPVSRTEASSNQGPSQSVLDPTEKIDLESVQSLMQEGKMYLEPGLTIARLAEAAKLPEHRLRRLINQQLGYRNFSDYLNGYRIDAAKSILSGRDQRNIPVLTIAMDLGYGSLGPFNRAFKERTGLTPTEFRKKALTEI